MGNSGRSPNRAMSGTEDWKCCEISGAMEHRPHVHGESGADSRVRLPAPDSWCNLAFVPPVPVDLEVAPGHSVSAISERLAPSV